MTDATNSWLGGRWIAVLFLLWNLLGVAAFVMQVLQDLDELAKTDAYQAAIFAAMPLWVWLAYAVAVTAATVGGLLLVLRRKGAVEATGIAVFAVIAQFSYTLFQTDIVAVRGFVAAAGFPIFIFVMELLQLAYARWMTARGLLR